MKKPPEGGLICWTCASLRGAAQVVGDHSGPSKLWHANRSFGVLCQKNGYRVPDGKPLLIIFAQN